MVLQNCLLQFLTPLSMTCFSSPWNLNLWDFSTLLSLFNGKYFTYTSWILWVVFLEVLIQKDKLEIHLNTVPVVISFMGDFVLFSFCSEEVWYFLIIEYHRLWYTFRDICSTQPILIFLGTMEPTFLHSYTE